MMFFFENLFHLDSQSHVSTDVEEWSRTLKGENGGGEIAGNWGKCRKLERKFSGNQIPVHQHKDTQWIHTTHSPLVPGKPSWVSRRTRLMGKLSKALGKNGAFVRTSTRLPMNTPIDRLTNATNSWFFPHKLLMNAKIQKLLCDKSLHILCMDVC